MQIAARLSPVELVTDLQAANLLKGWTIYNSEYEIEFEYLGTNTVFNDIVYDLEW